jgi:hypothetical protein
MSFLVTIILILIKRSRMRGESSAQIARNYTNSFFYSFFVGDEMWLRENEQRTGVLRQYHIMVLVLAPKMNSNTKFKERVTS